MEHFVAYHSVEVMGYDYSPGDTFDYHSKKPESILRGSLGEFVWLIVGSRVSGQMEYRLAGVYTPTTVTEGPEDWTVEGWGTPLRPAPVLNRLPWFPAFLRSQANFSLGFRLLTDFATIQALGTLAAAAESASRDEASLRVTSAATFDPANVADARERVMAEIVRRRGQPAFRAALLDAYRSTCVVSGCTIVEILEAAHIVPYRGPETNQIQNGLLLRTDLHALFDLGLLAVDGATMRIVVSPVLAASEYAELAGCPLREPSQPEQGPSLAALEHHRVRAGLTTH